MGLVRKVKDYFFQKALHGHGLPQRNGFLTTHLNKAIFLLEKYNTTSVNTLNQWADDCNIGIQKRHFVFFESGNGEDRPDYTYINKKEITWYNTLKHKVLDDLGVESYDFLLNLDAGYKRPMLFATKSIKADFKVGLLANSIKIYDLLVEGNPVDLKGNLSQISTLLNQINTEK